MVEITHYFDVYEAEQHPDVYSGPGCDEHAPCWWAWAAGDKDPEGPIGVALQFDATHFPPGTKVIVQVPCCPDCGEDARYDPVSDTFPNCDCGFSWFEWADARYS